MFKPFGEGRRILTNVAAFHRVDAIINSVAGT